MSGPTTPGNGFSSRWTHPTEGVDFSGFVIPTTETTPWGAEARVYQVRITLLADHSEPEVEERVHVGTWRREDHGWHGTVPKQGRGRPRTVGGGLFGLVSLTRHRPGPGDAPSAMVAFVGRCLAGDAPRMRALVLSTASAMARSLAGNLAGQARALDVALRDGDARDALV